jgi:hypothetical protein
MISSAADTRSKIFTSLLGTWMAESVQAQISLRVFFKRLEAQRATDCHHFAFYPHVAKALAV